MNDFSYTSGRSNFSFQTHIILPTFHGTRLYGVTVLFVVSGVARRHPSKDVLTFQKHAWLRNRYIWGSLVLVLVAAIITALVIALSGAESNSVHPSKAQLCYL
jgi:uncharacterized membrane protein YidH (DUF202 family)